MLDLRQLEAERDKADPFLITLSDETVMELRSPKALRANELVGFDIKNPVLALQVILGDDFEAFMNDENTTVYAMERVFTDWAERYGVLVNQGEDNALPTSSTGSARPSKRTSGSQRKAKAS